MIKLLVNGRRMVFEGDPETPLLWVLRDDANLTGTKYGCGIGLCGACTVHVDGEAIRSCQLPVSAVGESEVITIEGVATNTSDAVIEAWALENVPQCGYCQPGMVMAVHALLRDIPDPTRRDVDANITNLCRCGTYPRVRKAVLRAAEIAAAAREAADQSG
ncbi:MAG: (2Fe-2S)-binding protein [Pseudomonadota bacterium]